MAQSRENSLYYVLLAFFLVAVAALALRAGQPSTPAMPGVKSFSPLVIQEPVQVAPVAPAPVPQPSEASGPAEAPAIPPAGGN